MKINPRISDSFFKKASGKFQVNYACISAYACNNYAYVLGIDLTMIIGQRAADDLWLAFRVRACVRS